MTSKGGAQHAIAVTDRQFSRAYGSALRDYLADPQEAGLHTAYELGRKAVVRGLGPLELAAAHHDALVDLVREAAPNATVERATRAAGQFFLESLSACEIIQRTAREAHAAAAAEQQQAAMLRRLSGFLTDPSLAAGEQDSLTEALRLVAEEARELTGARWCIASANLGSRRLALTVCDPETEHPAGLGYAADFEQRSATATPAPEPARPSAVAEGDRARGSRVAVPLSWLDGVTFGSLTLVHEDDDAFSERDEAVLVHLAQMVSATLERAMLRRART
jgi:GAF domain-containing protein